MMRTLHSARLLLEPQTPLHAPAMLKVLSDPAIYAYENQPPVSLDALTQRFQRLEARQSPDGRQQWLNWVLRQRSDGELIGYVQATVQADGRALVAHELASRHWGQGLGSEAVQAMLDELAGSGSVRPVQPVHQALAIFKRANHRSLALLLRLGFAEPAADDPARSALEPDEQLMSRSLPV
jgi:ribosomal-protein-alanine N-acetyltransferase